MATKVREQKILATPIDDAAWAEELAWRSGIEEQQEATKSVSHDQNDGKPAMSLSFTVTLGAHVLNYGDVFRQAAGASRFGVDLSQKSMERSWRVKSPVEGRCPTARNGTERQAEALFEFLQR